MQGSTLCDILRAELGVKNNNQLAVALGVTAPAISNLNSAEELTEKRVAKFIKLAVNHQLGKQLSQAIDPIVEFFPVASNFKKSGTEYVPFDVDHHPELKSDLKSKIGIYTFYDSQGKIIYLGKTNKNLFDEMVQTYNRSITRYRLFRTNHVKSSYTKGSKKPQIQERETYFYETVKYFSCYSVQKDLIGALEAFGIRIIPNNIINKRIEKIRSALNASA